jgi:hypothetical protein
MCKQEKKKSEVEGDEGGEKIKRKRKRKRETGSCSGEREERGEVRV